MKELIGGGRKAGISGDVAGEGRGRTHGRVVQFSL